jgi:hypothetical protein
VLIILKNAISTISPVLVHLLISTLLAPWPATWLLLPSPDFISTLLAPYIEGVN